jgi:outer membrane protein
MLNKTFLFLLVFLTGILLPAIVPAQLPWSLEDCINHALENNLHIKQQQLGVDVARENLNQGQAGRFPSLNANASHGYNFGRTVDPFTNEFATERVQSNNFSVSSGVTLFSGFQIHNSIQLREFELKASQYDVETMRNDISLAVASAYLQILYSLEMVEIAVNQLEITQQQVERTAQLVSAGTLPRGSLLTVQAQAAGEELQLVNAQNQLDIAFLNLTQLLDIPTTEGFELAVPEITILPDDDLSMSPLQVYSTAVLTQANVKASQVRVSSAEKGLLIAKGGRSPMLSLRGSYGTGYSGASREVVEVIEGSPRQIGLTETGVPVFAPSIEVLSRIKPFSDQLNDNRNRNIGLFLTIPIFNNLQTRSAIGRAQISLENARLGHQLVRDQLFKTIQQAHADAQGALKRYEATNINVVALEESFRYTEQRFNVGMVNSLEYNDAKNRLTAAQSELLQSKYEFVFRIKVLDFYMGNPLGIL